MERRFIKTDMVVFYDKKLSLGAKYLYAEIDNKAQKEGYCWAGNAYFADIMSCSDRTVRSYLSELIDLGYVEIQVKGSLRNIIPCEPLPGSQLPPGRKNFSAGGGSLLPHIKNIDLEHNLEHNLEGGDVKPEPVKTETPVIPIKTIAEGIALIPFPPAAPPPPPAPVGQRQPGGASWWQSQRDAFTGNRIMIEQICVSRRITEDKLTKLMIRYLDDLEIKDDRKESAELRRHFLNWFNKGRQNDFIAPDGTLKDEISNANGATTTGEIPTVGGVHLTPTELRTKHFFDVEYPAKIREIEAERASKRLGNVGSGGGHAGT